MIFREVLLSRVECVARLIDGKFVVGMFSGNTVTLRETENKIDTRDHFISVWEKFHTPVFDGFEKVENDKQN